MPFVTQLSTDLQNALLKDIVTGIGVEVILDPDGKALDISGYVDRNASLVIQKQKSILPYGSLGAFTVKEVRLRLINKDDYFNHYKKSSPFYYATTRLFAAKPASQGYIDVLRAMAVNWRKTRSSTSSRGRTGSSLPLGILIPPPIRILTASTWVHRVVVRDPLILTPGRWWKRTRRWGKRWLSAPWWMGLRIKLTSSGAM